MNLKRGKLVCGVGINDADYVVKVMETIGYVDGKQRRRLVWICPSYRIWVNMLVRCYNEKFHTKNSTYKGCSVYEEWLTFSNFKAWMETQDWQGKQLDKDLITEGNKVYSPDTCVFVSVKINNFLIESGAARGEYPIGVYYMKKPEDMVNEFTKPYRAVISDASGKKKHLGVFTSPEEAHAAWLKAKLEQAKVIAAEVISEGGDPRIAKAIVERYTNYGIEGVDNEEKAE